MRWIVLVVMVMVMGTTAKGTEEKCGVTLFKAPTWKYLWFCCDPFVAAVYQTNMTMQSVNDDYYHVMVGYAPSGNCAGGHDAYFSSSLYPHFSSVWSDDYMGNYNATISQSSQIPLRSYTAVTGIQCTNLVFSCQLYVWSLQQACGLV